MSKIINNANNILTGFLTKRELLEYKELISNLSIVESQYQKSIEKSKPQYSEWYHYIAKIDLLISFAQRKLKKEKFLDMLFHLGESAFNRGEFGEAEKLFLHIITEVKDNPALEGLEAKTNLFLSEIYIKYSYWQKSLRYLKTAQKIFTKKKNDNGIRQCNNIIGIIEAEKGNLKKAKAHFKKNLFSENPEYDISSRGILEMNMGILNTIQGDFDTAVVFYKKALERFKQNGDTRRIAEVEHNLGMLYTQKGEERKALIEFNKSIMLQLKSGNTNILGLSYLQIAYIYTRLKDFTLANDFAGKAMSICTQSNDQLSIADIYKIKGIIERELKNFKVSESYLLASIRRNCELENNLNEAESNYELGILYTMTGKQTEAKKAFVSAYNIFKRIGCTHMKQKVAELLHLN